MNNNKPIDQLEKFLDALTEDTLNMSDEEVLSEATSDFGNSDKEADKVRATIRKAVLSTGDNDLKTVKRFYGNSTFRSLEMPNNLQNGLKMNGQLANPTFGIAAKNSKTKKSAIRQKPKK